jgi:hypothetical protein
MADYGLDITAQSLPDYDEWGPDQHWGCTDWMVWYDKLKEEYGKNEARVVWKSAWEKQGYWDVLYKIALELFLRKINWILQDYLVTFWLV